MCPGQHALTLSSDIPDVAKGCGMCYPVCGMVHIKEPLLLVQRVAHVATAGFLSCYLSGPLLRRHMTLKVLSVLIWLMGSEREINISGQVREFNMHNQSKLL